MKYINDVNNLNRLRSADVLSSLRDIKLLDTENTFTGSYILASKFDNTDACIIAALKLRSSNSYDSADDPIIFGLLEKAYNQGSSNAAKYMGDMYLNVDPSWDLGIGAICWYERAFMRNKSDAHVNRILSRRYHFTGKLCPKIRKDIVLTDEKDRRRVYSPFFTSAYRTNYFYF